MADKKLVKLADLPAEKVPAAFRAESYFDFDAHPFAHSALFAQTSNLIEVLASIERYAVDWLKRTIDARLTDTDSDRHIHRDVLPSGIAHGRFEVVVERGAVFDPATVIGHARDRNRIYVAAGASVVGVNLWPAGGDIYIGPGTVVEPGAGIKGPTIIGCNNEIRQGAYFRGSVIVGDDGVFRGEIKNSVMMNGANFPHPGYVGDSLCGCNTHFGNQAGTANLGLFYALGRKVNVTIELDGVMYDLGRPKVGVILGDFTQVGCNTVTAPGGFLGPYSVVYALTSLPKGVSPSDVLIKYKPTLERVPFDRTFKSQQA